MVSLTNLIEPDALTEPLAILIIGIMAMGMVLFLKMRHALLAVIWFLTVMVLVLVILINLHFIWFWVMVMLMAATVAIAALFRFFVIPARGV